ncbi:MAG: TonB-dependent receptor [Acidobacteriota bacterium]
MQRFATGAGGALVLIAGVLAAQDFRATITGQVTDATRSAIPGATVRAIQRSTAAVTETKTTQEGYFTLPYLEPSVYDIEATAPGFNKLRKENVTLMVADKLDLPLVLTVGSVAEEVTVIAAAETVQGADASGGLNFDSIQTSEYPLDGRQVYMLMDLTPGVLFTQEQFGVTGFSGTRGWDVNGKYVMNGGVEGTNSFTLNGAPISLTGSWQVSPNVDAIQEFKVMTNTYDAQIGRTGGGSVNTTLKAGSNAWHGSLSYFHRNAILDANHLQSNRIGAPRGKHITHDFSGTLHGPIRKDREFVMLSFQGYRQRVPFPVTSDTPPLDIRDGQHFTPHRINVYDPLTARDCIPGLDTANVNTQCTTPYIRDPFPDNVIPSSRFHPSAAKILSFYPAPNMPGLTQNFVSSGNTGKYRFDQPLGRWDRHLSDYSRLFAIVTFQHGHEYRNQNGFAGPAAIGNIWSQRRNMNFIANYNRILSPVSVLDLRASFGRFTSYFPDGELESDVTAASLGMIRMPYAPTSTRNRAPRIQLNQYEDILGNSYTWSSDNQWNIVPTLTTTRGARTLKFGLDLVYVMRASGNSGRANGLFSFNRKYTQRYPLRGGNNQDGSGIGDLLLGHAGDGYIEWNDTYYRTWPYVGFFVQSDWKVRRGLTLNLGLRYDVQFPWVERWNRVNQGFDFNAKNPFSDQALARWAELKAQYDAANPRFPYPPPPPVLLGGKTFVNPEGPRRTYDTDWQNIQPRVGLAWLIRSDFVLRTGFGLFHKTATQNNYTDGFSQRTDYMDSLDGGISPASGLSGPYSLDDPYPSGLVRPMGRTLGLLTNVGQAISLDGRQRMVPRNFQYSFGIQKRVFWGVRIDASYVGSVTNKDPMAIGLNQMPWDIMMTGQKVQNFGDRTVANPFYGTLPETSNLGASPTIAARSLYRPYPLFEGITMGTNPWGRYLYDSLQLRVEKRFFGNRSKAGALVAIFSYTFSKTFEENHRLNNWNLNEPPIHQLASYDKPQNIAFHGVWDLPFGRGRRLFSRPGRLDPFVSGWNVNWIFRFLSGNPVAKPDRIFICESYFAPVQTRDTWFNNDQTCYRSRISNYSLRTTEDRFSNIRQPDSPSLNVSAGKTFRFREGWSFNLRVEAFNVTNTPLFGGPNTDASNVRFGMLPLDQRNFPRHVQVAGKIQF